MTFDILLFIHARVNDNYIKIFLVSKKYSKNQYLIIEKGINQKFKTRQTIELVPYTKSKI